MYNLIYLFYCFNIKFKYFRGNHTVQGSEFEWSFINITVQACAKYLCESYTQLGYYACLIINVSKKFVHGIIKHIINSTQAYPT